MSNIRFLVMDLDVVLEKGDVQNVNDEKPFMNIDSKDAFAIREVLPRLSIIPVMITPQKNDSIEFACRKLGIFELHQGRQDKLSCMMDVLEAWSVIDKKRYTLRNVVYINAHMPDYELMEKVRDQGGIVACTADAADEIKRIADYVCAVPGGSGAVREIIECIAGHAWHKKDEFADDMLQAFLSSAISDVSSNIQFADTKVSIIMGALATILTCMLSSNGAFIQDIVNIKQQCWQMHLLVVMLTIFAMSVAIIFIAGTLTIREHSSKIEYDSKWFIPKEMIKNQSIEEYLQNIRGMAKKDIIENMALELWKLNDINQQKQTTVRLTIYFFAVAIITGAAIVFLLILFGGI